MRFIPLLFMLTISCLAINAQISQCPTIAVEGPSGLTRLGEPMSFIAKIPRTSTSDSLRYEWTVTSDAKIVNGQGTSSITVDTVGLTPNINIIATVKITGLSTTCENTASATAGLMQISCGLPFDEYTRPSWNEERAHLDNLFVHMQLNADSKAFFHIYYLETSTIANVRKHLTKVVKHLRLRDKNFDLTRVTFGLERSDEERTVLDLRQTSADPIVCKDCEIVRGANIPR